MAHAIDEGFDVIAAVRRTNRIVQVGTQRRSSELFIEAKKLMDSGQLGKVHLVTSWWLNGHTRLRQDRIAPGDLDWNQWLGSAPRRTEDAFRFFNWYWFWDYSGGLLVGQAAHVLDAIQWMMNSRQPLAVTCSGIRPELPGVDVPLTANIAVEYPDNYLATFTLGYSAMQYNTANDQLKQFHGDKARFDVGRESYALYPESNALDMKASVEKRQPRSFSFAAPSHIRNFLECIRSRREPNAPVERGQDTNIVLCMAMQSMREGRRLKWNAQARRVEG
jgi:predicted dehydrogenase